MRNLLYILLLLILSIPGIIGITCLYDEKPLHGDINRNNLFVPNDFCWDIWFEGSYQKEMEKSASAGTGARNLLIRIANHLNYYLLRTTDNENVVIGKENCLYEKGYITAYSGRNFCGEYFITHAIDDFKRLQKILKEKFGTNLVLVIEPGKAGTFPEFIPESEGRHGNATDNYSVFIKECSKRNLACLNLQQYFLQMKDSSRYLLFSPYGVHWTTYGMYLAADTLLSYLGKTTGLNMADIRINEIQLTDTTKDVDFDLENTLNLLYDLPHKTFAFPVISWDTAGRDRPDVLTIADSYFWMMYNHGIPDMAFANKEYWYYYKTIYPNIWLDNSKWLKDIDRRAVTEKQDVILLMITEMNLHRAFWGFTDELLGWYDTARVKDPLFEAMKFILNDDLLYKMVLKRSELWSCPFEVALQRFAQSLIEFRKAAENPDVKRFWTTYNELYLLKN